MEVNRNSTKVKANRPSQEKNVLKEYVITTVDSWRPSKNSTSAVN